MLSNTYGDGDISERTCREWFQRFQNGDFDVDLIDLILTSLCSATRGLLATDHVILNHGQVTWTTPELAPPSPNYHTTPTGGHFSSRQI
ncbi:hypothetical protein TNCV_1248951 [Trichonephila clavipes]|nr:hypothetical protein TNCV_1248951 [Trichonephila clavipes]